MYKILLHRNAAKACRILDETQAVAKILGHERWFIDVLV